MLELLTKWHPEDDPITRAQVETLMELVGDLLTEKALEGFLIVCSRLVDNFGGHRTNELANIFRTSRAEGRLALVRSLEYLNEWVGGMEAYERLYPVTINPSNPAFPQMKVLGVETLEPYVYRVLSSDQVVRGTSELTRAYIVRTGRLPAASIEVAPVLRAKPFYHWCSYEKWDSPEATAAALQILPEWKSDCRLRARIRTADIANSTFMAFNGDRNDPTDETLRFYNYFFEPLAQDHPVLEGGGVQVGVDGSPPVDQLEEWDVATKGWRTVIAAPPLIRVQMPTQSTER